MAKHVASQPGQPRAQIRGFDIQSGANLLEGQGRGARVGENPVLSFPAQAHHPARAAQLDRALDAVLKHRQQEALHR